jgi:Uncharacterized conserved protein
MKKAIVLTNGILHTGDAKTAHGLIRESGRFEIIGVVDHAHAGQDAGEVLDGKQRGIPVVEGIAEGVALGPAYCIIGVATSGGYLPASLLEDIRYAVSKGISVVNGLHDYLLEHEDIVALAAATGAELIDIRKPKKFSQLKFWTGEILRLTTPVVAVMGTDCALGKRTTTRFILHEGEQAGLNVAMIYTGQTGWLQGGEYGFIFDSTLNDFVSGELEDAILRCAKETRPDIILLEGQSALRNPSGPGGAEFLVSGQAKHVILVHAPKRKFYEHTPEWGEIPSLASEIELIAYYGSKVIAVALNTEHCTPEEARTYKEALADELGLPVFLPLQEGCAGIIPLLKDIIAERKTDEHHSSPAL